MGFDPIGPEIRIVSGAGQMILVRRAGEEHVHASDDGRQGGRVLELGVDIELRFRVAGGPGSPVRPASDAGHGPIPMPSWLHPRRPPAS